MSLDIKKLNPWNWFKHEEDEKSRDVSSNQQRRHSGSNLPMAYQHDPLWGIHREIDRLFDDVFSQFSLSSQSRGVPSLLGKTSSMDHVSNAFLKPNVDIKENKKNYKISVEVPGVEESDIKLELVDGSLVIRGEKRHENEEKDEHYHSVERSYGSFQRVLALPEDVNEDDIDAKFKNGVLTITAPRKQLAKPKENTKVIDINRAA
ncbi:MAG: heat-shock protein Hsp20 [Micavibrio sp.]|nr:heat-shock protein Hsp20 [Micavibrio sp.]